MIGDAKFTRRDSLSFMAAMPLTMILSSAGPYQIDNGILRDEFEVAILTDKEESQDWKSWPETVREQVENAFQYKLRELGDGAKVISDQSLCARRYDLSRCPWMLYRTIIVEYPA